ncbi:MAG: CBS domain-containing protein, partial [Desulfuromonadales bacterium]|nr:CBS domain-containing protein [Desulfuromonadales bacterium]
EPRDRGELKELLYESLQRGLLDADALAMMEGVLEVSEMHACDAMVPRSQMVVIPRKDKLSDVMPCVVESGHSRFPVIGEDRDEIEGVLLAKDLLRFFSEDAKPFDLTGLMRPALVIPESMRLDVLLREFRDSRNHLAIVVDEYGGVAGLITLEDVLEEIVGEIGDEHDEEEEADVTVLGDNRYMVNALTPIDEFNEAFQCNLSDE